jgi:hypothetical protein
LHSLILHSLIVRGIFKINKSRPACSKNQVRNNRRIDSSGDIMYAPGHQEILTNMLANVQLGSQPYTQQPQYLQPMSYPPNINFPSSPTNGPTSTSFPNEMIPSTLEQPYIRSVGPTPGTLDRMKRIVAKQKSCHGTSFFDSSDRRTKCCGSRVAGCRFSIPNQLWTSDFGGRYTRSEDIARCQGSTKHAVFHHFTGSRDGKNSPQRNIFKKPHRVVQNGLDGR